MRQPRPDDTARTADVTPDSLSGNVEGGCAAAAAVEHALRLTDDDSLAAAVATAGTPQARYAAVGRLTTATGARLRAGQPLYVWARAGEVADVDPNWRETLPAVASTAWSRLELACALLGEPVDTTDPLSQLWHAECAVWTAPTEPAQDASGGGPR
jgi:hypothetical protein